MHVTTGVAWFWEHFHVSQRLVFVRFNDAYLQALSSERARLCHGCSQLVVLQLPGYFIISIHLYTLGRFCITQSKIPGKNSFWWPMHF